MIIIGTFRHSIELEQALCRLENIGIPREQLLVVNMNVDAEAFLSDKQQAANTYSKGFEVGMACATALSVIGTSVGFIMPWGPILAGLMAGLIGFFFGFGVVVIFQRKTGRRWIRIPEVTVIVQCNANQSELIQNVMWSNEALAVGLAHASAE